MRYVVGIDLGTTHSVLCSSDASRPELRLLEIPQLVAPGEIATRPLLPSFLYLPAHGELPEAETRLPWGDAPITGVLARKLGAKVPMRLVASAKSWICHGGINRRAEVLPWGAPDGEAHVSPFEAQVLYLAHLRAAWNFAHPDAPLDAQEVVLTVPASFDEGARELTLQAAARAGLGAVHLLEEPQAAFYDFVGAHEAELTRILGGAKLALVVDVGGGTTDLTLLQVIAGDPPSLERIAVGGHLLLGGDNMDAALAHHALAKAKLEAKLDASEWSALMQAVREAKERLLANDAPAEITIAIQRRGSRLIGSTLSVKLTREEVCATLLDGFLPFTSPTDVAERHARAGLTTLGLPYATEPAIGRHVCAFLRKHATAAADAGAQVVDGLPRPDVVLLNGGVFNAQAMVARFSEVLARWYGGEVRLLPHTSLDTAVARGAARFALAKRGMGRVIRGGTARAYYIGVEGADGAQRALCLAPRGMEEGATVRLGERVFELVLGKRVAFPLFAYTGDRVDAPGALIPVTDELEALAPVETAFRGEGKAAQAVTLSVTLAESGALEASLVTVQLPPQRFRLEFALAPAPNPAPSAAIASEPRHPRASDAARLIEGAFASKDEQRPRALRSALEEMLGERGTWSAGLCRALADALLAQATRRGASAQHELAWLRLLGWCLRPGLGMDGDGARIQALWPELAQGLRFPKKGHVVEWWILWRRVAAGLAMAEQAALWEIAQKAPRSAELVQLACALERLPRADKERVGEWFFAHAPTSFLPIGRLGARMPMHADPEDAVSPEVAARWLDRLLALDWKTSEGAPFAATMIARMSGDPTRDVDSALRASVAARLDAHTAPAAWAEMVRTKSALSESDAARMLGDALPTGLRVLR